MVGFCEGFSENGKARQTLTEPLVEESGQMGRRQSLAWTEVGQFINQEHGSYNMDRSCGSESGLVDGFWICAALTMLNSARWMMGLEMRWP